MRVEVIDGKTFVCQEKVYEIGDELELTEGEQKVLAEIRGLRQELRSMKQELINQCHLAEKNFLPALGDIAHSMSSKAIEYSYKMSRFVNDLQSRVGGLLPITFDEGQTKVIVRNRQSEGQGLEDVNYTVASVKKTMGMARLEDQRLIAVGIAGKKEAVRIDLGANDRYDFQPVEFFAETKGVPLRDAIAKVVEELLKFRLYLTDSMILLKAGEKDTCEGAVLNLSIQSPDPQAQKGRWEGITAYAKDMAAGTLVMISRKMPEPGKPLAVEQVAVSYLPREGDPMTLLFSAIVENGERRFVRGAEWTKGFVGPGGEERFKPLVKG
jgi:hypothetical protein